MFSVAQAHADLTVAVAIPGGLGICCNNKSDAASPRPLLFVITRAEDAPTERTKGSLRNCSWCFRWHRHRATGRRRFLRFFSWIVERLDVPPNAPRELTFLPAVDVPAERKRRAVKYSGAFHVRAHRPMLGCIGRCTSADKKRAKSGKFTSARSPTDRDGSSLATEADSEFYFLHRRTPPKRVR